MYRNEEGNISSDKTEGGYQVEEIEENENGEIYLRAKHGVKGDTDNTEYIGMRISCIHHI